MGDVHIGETPAELQASYVGDETPFPTDTTLQFPTREYLRPEVGLLFEVLFPRCWNAGTLVDDRAAIRDRLVELGRHMAQGIEPYRSSTTDADADTDTAVDVDAVVDAVLGELPALRETVKRDVVAAYRGDPAAKGHLEVIRSYPGLHATTVQRVAHCLYERGVPEYARELTEYAKAETGIDIHPGATLGEYCFIDHGTGVVIGETATVGEWTRIYQNVTLGALHFEEEEDDEHLLKKGYKRHPDVGDHVVIGAGSNILGPVTVGNHVSIGANSWITEDVPDHTSVFIAEHPKQVRKKND